MRCEMAVAAHKPAPIPSGALYTPVRVAAFRDDKPWRTADGRLYARDDEDGGLSRKNPLYCELTAHWWLWRHSGADALGLCHYRRYFARSRLGGRSKRLLTHRDAEALLAQYDLLLPVKRHYWIETNASQYCHAHGAEGLQALRQAVAQLPDPRYLPAFDTVMRRRSGHRFNMLLARREVFDAYSAWLFDVLARTEALLADPQPRVLGYLAERLTDVWLEVHPLRVKELPVLHTESQHWPRKILRFLLRRLRGGRMSRR